MSCGSCLEIVFHMINGLELKFEETDESKAKELLNGIRPHKVFSEKQLSLLGESSATRIKQDFVSYIEFNTSQKIEWQYLTHIDGVMLLSKDKFAKAIQTELEQPETISDSSQQNRPLSLFMELMMTDGISWFLRVFAQPLKPMDRAELAMVMRDLSGFHAIRPEGGAVLFNMNNVISWTTYPTALLDVKNTWKIEKS